MTLSRAAISPHLYFSAITRANVSELDCLTLKG